jgi:hypothetical protein
VPNTLQEKDWLVLLNRIKNGRCLPFLGAGACYGLLPLGSDLARDWAKKYGYPFTDSDDLVRVAQFVAVENGDSIFPKELLLEQFKQSGSPNFRDPDEPHAVLADLPLPIYMTTNYDSFMVQALENRHRDARREMCRWNELLKDQPSVFDREPPFTPTVANPVVFHLHGHTVPESLVLTEDDYLSFLGSIARDPQLLPPAIQRTLAGSSCLFIGYRMADWNFRVIFQGLRQSMKLMSVAVMLAPAGDSEETKEKARAYLDHYYAALDMRIYWGTAREFCAELRRRWQESGYGP